MFYDKDLVVNIEVLETMRELSICSICSGLVIDPKQCDKCENAFCRICIDSWLKKSNSCPFKCQNPIFKEAGRTLKTMINKLILRCPYGCHKTFSYENLKTHYCENKELNFKVCPCCGTKVISSEIKVNYDEEINKRNKLLEEENKLLKEENNKLKIQLQKLNIDKGDNLNGNLDKKLNFNYKEENIKERKERNIIEKNIIYQSPIDERCYKENIFVEKKPNKRVIQKEIIDEVKNERKKKERGENIDLKELTCKHKCKRNLRRGMIYLFDCCRNYFECKKCHNELSDHFGIKPRLVICTKCKIENDSRNLNCNKCDSLIYLEPYLKPFKQY